MCILFFSLTNTPGAGKFKLILASNRDEHFLRPAKPAHIWEKNTNVIAGMDMTPGKEGGTWLAASKYGRIAVLLNYSSVSSKPDKQGRGFLASEFVAHETNSVNYLEDLKINSKLYNPFNLVTIDLKDPELKIRRYCNIDPENIVGYPENTYAFSNSPINEFFQKEVFGKKLFNEVVHQYGQSVETKDLLVEKLLGIMQNETQNYPDPVIEGFETISPHMRRPLSSIFVQTPDLQYGTRTHTVILVDNEDNMDFYEWTLKIPIENNTYEWIKSHHRIKLD